MSQGIKFLNLKMFLRYVQGGLLRIVNTIIKKDPQCILFVPQATCVKDGYDIINWTGDNALCLFHYMIESGDYDSYNYVVVMDFPEKMEDYHKYCLELNSKAKVSLVSRGKANKVFWKSKYIFVSSSIFTFNAKSSNQILVDLNYFTPFKNDYPFEEPFRRIIYRTRKCFDYVVTTSHLASRIQALDLGLPLSSFLELGFPRNDIFYSNNQGLVLSYIQKYFFEDTKRIITFTPTYRDYEEDERTKRDLFGYTSLDYYKLDEILNNNNAVIIVKMHTLQVENVRIERIKNQCSRIILFDELNKQFSLYQCLAESDCLITDYTSVYFDYLHRDKPVIFNFYDIEKYSQYRGLSYYPIESFVAGSIVKKPEELLDAIEMVLRGGDPYQSQRKILKNLFDCHYDGLSAQRISECFFSEKSNTIMSDRIKIRNGIYKNS